MPVTNACWVVAVVRHQRTAPGRNPVATRTGAAAAPGLANVPAAVLSVIA